LRNSSGVWAQVERRVPGFLGREAFFGGLVEALGLADPVGLLQPGHAGLHADRLEAFLLVFLHRLDRLGVVAAVGVAVDHEAVAALAPEQLVHRHAGQLPLDVPECHVDGRDGGHGHGTAPPVGATVEVLPDVFDVARIAADEAREHVLVEVGLDGEFTAVEGRVAESDNPFVGDDLHGDEVAARAGDDGLDAFDLQFSLQGKWGRSAGCRS